MKLTIFKYIAIALLLVDFMTMIFVAVDIDILFNNGTISNLLFINTFLAPAISIILLCADVIMKNNK